MMIRTWLRGEDIILTMPFHSLNKMLGQSWEGGSVMAVGDMVARGKSL